MLQNLNSSQPFACMLIIFTSCSFSLFVFVCLGNQLNSVAHQFSPCLSCLFLSVQGFSYIVAFNSTTVHSLPMAVNVLSNALLKGFNGTGHINTWTKPFDYVSNAKFFHNCPSMWLK